METIWLQRPSPDVPWGFRLVGGREFNVPLCVQRVTPGSVAAAALGPGDEFLKVGNVVTSGLMHTDAMELVKQAGNILQLTIRKGDPSAPNPMSPEPLTSGPPQFSTTPRGGGGYTGPPAPSYNTTPRNLGSQHQSATPRPMKIEIQRVDPPAQRQPPQRSYSSSYHDDPSFPDYTIPYKQQDPIHDSPGGPVDLRVREEPPPRRGYSSMSLPRGARGASVPPPDTSFFNGASGPPAYAPPGYNQVQSEPRAQPARVKTGLQFQISTPQKPQQFQPQAYTPSAAQSSYKPQSFNTTPRSYSRPVSPQSYSRPLSPQPYSSPLSPQSSQQSAPQYATVDRRAPSPLRNGPYDQSNIHGSGPNTYATLPHTKPSPAPSTNNYRPSVQNFNHQPSFNKSPMPFSPSSLNVNTTSPTAGAPVGAARFSPVVRSVQSPMASPGGAYQPAHSAGPQRRVSFDQGIHEPAYHPRAHQMKSPPPPEPAMASPYTSPAYSRSSSGPDPYSRSNSQFEDPTAAPDFSSSVPQRPAYSRQSSRGEPSPAPYGASPTPYGSTPAPYGSTPAPYGSTPAPYGSNPNQYGSTPTPYGSTPTPYGSSPTPYGSTATPYGSNPTPYGSTPTPYGSTATPYGSNPTPYGSTPTPYGSSPTPYRPQQSPLSPGSDAGSGYGPAYGGNQYRGYDPSGVSAGMNSMSINSPSYEPQPPPVAAPPPPPPPPPGPPPPPAPPLNSWSPTPYRRPSNQSMDSEEGGEKIPDQLLGTMLKASKSGGPKPFSYGIDMTELKKKMGPPTAPKPRGKKAAGPQRRVQQETPPDMPQGPPKKQAGHIQSDYFLSRDDGPRGSIDQTSLSVNMGNNPKKQSKSFKILQWMTETERDEEGQSEEPAVQTAPKSKRRTSRDHGSRHNADDDEMRFTGLHSKKVIPSNTFKRLQKMPSEERSLPVNDAPNGDVDGDENIGNYDETSIRYKGKSIPSPSFRVLQSWAENDPENYAGPAAGTTKKAEEEEDDLPDTLSSEDMANVRYKGGNIPSKLFKTLQKSVGDDTPTEKPVEAQPVSSPSAVEVNGTAESVAPPPSSAGDSSVIVLDTPIVLETPIAASSDDVTDF